MSDENSIDATKPKTAETGTPTNEDTTSVQGDASGRRRDAKGHFISNSTKPIGHKSSKDREDKALDQNTVTINIVKDKKPLPPKDFEGRLEDAKERTAISFIRSVIARQAKCINIDGRKYYSADLWQRRAEELKFYQKGFNESIKTMDNAANTISALTDAYDRLCTYKVAWKGIAIGLIIWTVLLHIVCPLISRLWSNTTEDSIVQTEKLEKPETAVSAE